MWPTIKYTIYLCTSNLVKHLGEDCACVIPVHMLWLMALALAREIQDQQAVTVVLLSSLRDMLKKLANLHAVYKAPYLVLVN